MSISTKDRAAGGALAIFAIVVLAAAVVGFIREKQALLFPPTTLEPSRERAERWLEAVDKPDSKRSILLAEMIAPDNPRAVPPPEYLELAEKAGLSMRFFNPPYTVLDFCYWLDAVKLRKVAGELVSKPGDPMSVVFQAVRDKVKATPPEKIKEAKPHFLPLQTWESGDGDVSEQYLLLACMLAQLGYQANLVFLFLENDSSPLHMLAEARDGKDTYVFDFYSGFYAKMSATELSVNRHILNGKWPEPWIQALGKRVYAVPALAPDYRLCNQNLRKRLLQSGAEDIAFFGVDPLQRMRNLKRSVGPLPKGCYFILWPPPMDFIQNAPFFPRKWLKRPTQSKPTRNQPKPDANKTKSASTKNTTPTSRPGLWRN